MNPDPFDKDSYLRSKLEEDQLDIPEFSMKKSKWSRFLHYLASPAKDPLESVVSTKTGVISLKILPVAGGAVLVLAQFLFIS